MHISIQFVQVHITNTGLPGLYPKENLRLAGATGLRVSMSGATCSGGGGSGREAKEAASSGGKDGTDSGPGCGSALCPGSGMSLQREACMSVLLGLPDARCLLSGTLPLSPFHPGGLHLSSHFQAQLWSHGIVPWREPFPVLTEFAAWASGSLMAGWREINMA